MRAVIRRASTARYCEQPTMSPQLGTVRVRREDKTTAVQELWRRFLADPAQWWDNRFNKRNPKLPDFVHRETKEALWIDSWLDPPWVEEELSAFDQSHKDGIRRPSRARFSFWLSLNWMECTTVSPNLSKACLLSKKFTPSVVLGRILNQ